MLLEHAINDNTTAPTGHHDLSNTKEAPQPATVAGVRHVVTGHSGIRSFTNARNKDGPEPPQTFGNLTIHDNNNVPIFSEFLTIRK